MPGCESAWHKRWKARFAHTEVRHDKLPDSHKCRYADAVSDDMQCAIEFQHSSIHADEVRQRNEDYGRHAKPVAWVLDGTGVATSPTLFHGTTLLEFSWGHHWKHESFAGSEHVYLHVDDSIFRMRPSSVRSGMVHVASGRGVDAFVAALRAGEPDALWSTAEDTPQCRFYYKQRGAGNGKTYEAVRLLQGGDSEGISDLKTTYIYLTKMHSAKTNIHDELVQQRDAGTLAFDGECHTTAGRQYRFTGVRKSDGERVEAIIGTLDSFMYAMADKDAALRAGGNNYFGQLMATIREGHAAANKYTGAVHYGGLPALLNRRSLVVLDEGQDPHPDYVESLAAIAKATHVDVLVIGDKLQSIWMADNCLTRLADARSLQGVPVERLGARNVVMRFKHAGLMDFVNRAIRFEAYGLPSISGVDPDHDDCDPEPVVLFTQRNITSKTPSQQVGDEVARIVSMLAAQVAAHGYAPEDFLLIFPYLTGNVLAECLQTALAEFWIGKFQEREYQDSALAAHACWGACIDDIRGGAFERYDLAYLHKSEEGRPINLDDSANATRLMSIHASKGLGCTVVFLLGMSEAVLKNCYCKDDESGLKYESLLHVAVTRMKKKLFVGLPESPDDVTKRFSHGGYAGEQTLQRDSVKSLVVARFVLESQDHYHKLNEHFFVKSGFAEAADSAVRQGATEVVGWGHHAVRYHVMFYLMEREAHNSSSETGGHIARVMDDVARGRVVAMKPRDYYDALHDIAHPAAPARQAPSGARAIPVLALGFARARYQRRLEEVIGQVQEQIKGAMLVNKLPELDPISTCVLVHVQGVLRNGKYAAFGAMELYRILEAADPASRASLDAKHKVRETIDNHYQDVERVPKLFDAFRAGTPGPVRYVVLPTLTFKGRDDTFKLYHRLDMMAYTRDSVSVLSLRPTFSQLNARDAFVGALLDTFFAVNYDDEDRGRYGDGAKRVATHVFTLSDHAPVRLEVAGYVRGGPGERLLKDCVRDAMADHFAPTNRLLAERMAECVGACDDGLAAIERMEEELDGSPQKPPKYAQRYVQRRRALVEDAERRAVSPGEASVAERALADIERSLASDLDKWLK
jgi:hypothetical protein